MAILKWFSTVQSIKDTENKLALSTFADTPTYSLKGMKTKCKPLKVYDGDTLWIAFIIEKKIRKIRVRMFGYESAKTIPAKLHLESLIHSQTLLDVEFFDYDKCGNPLVKLYVKDCCINGQMIKDGHGKPHYGQTKEKW